MIEIAEKISVGVRMRAEFFVRINKLLIFVRGIASSTNIQLQQIVSWLCPHFGFAFSPTNCVCRDLEPRESTFAER